ncbi:hypothetical protein [uncultured Methylibium sp.]|uniref:hypothetical protein n=1 Tax=uncultured Methylibium sp. TaxID=381093 RepID=UPI0025D41FF3|nr:hypothetical protein [uncultured Methylibium sp.]
MESARTAAGNQAAAMAGAAAMDATSAVKGPPEAAVLLLSELPRGHDLRTCPLGQVGAECRNKLGKEWRNVARWRIAANSYDELAGALARVCGAVRMMEGLDAGRVAKMLRDCIEHVEAVGQTSARGEGMVARASRA